MLGDIQVPITKKALVIGGGVAGIQAALDIAEGGQQVILVEKTPSIGGRMAGLSETFPTLDCSPCSLTPKMVDCARHKNIKLYTYSEIEEIKGYLGNFEVTIRKKARFIKESICTGCGMCYQKCPQKKILSEFNEGMGFRTAVYVPFPQAVPNIPVIDKVTCLKLLKNRFGLCEKVCPPGAIDYTQQDEIITEKVGASSCTGFELIPNNLYGEYGYGKYRTAVVCSLSGLCASGPARVKLAPIGRQVPERGLYSVRRLARPSKASLCSKSAVCIRPSKPCSINIRSHGQAYVFYIDIRAGGKGYEEFVTRAIEEDGAVYLRGRVSRIYRKKDKLIVRGMDTLSGNKVEIETDMVVLASAMVAPKGIEKLYQKLGTSYEKYNWLTEAHPKLRPVETTNAGIFLAGACQAPKDIPDAVSQASGAACKVMALFSRDTLNKEGTVARINETLCTGCQMCINACPYKAIELKDIKNKQGQLIRRQPGQ